MLSKSNYRLYDDNAINKLKQILFFRQLEIPLDDKIKGYQLNNIIKG